MRIAIVGAGISGLTCAYLLREQHEIVLYEAESWIGGHTHTVDVDLPSGQWAVDTGFIVYNDRTYPRFIKLLNQLGIQGNPTRMSFSVTNEVTGLEYCGSSLNGLFSQRRNLINPTFLRLLKDLLRFNKESQAVLAGDENPSLGVYLDQQGYSKAFQDNYLLPMAAAIWSGPVADIGDFPIQEFVRFFENHGLLQIRNRPQWRVIPGGSRSYVEKIMQGLANVKLAKAVTRVRRAEDAVIVQDATGEARFDHVVMACHSDQALGLLEDATAAEQSVLGAIPYRGNDVVLHTDSQLLPRQRRAIAAWNYRLTGDDTVPATVTYHMNTLQGLAASEDICVTLNQSEAIDPDHILGRWRYDHPVFDQASVAAQARRAEIDGVANTHFCGAYWHNGFHEDGVRSALPIVERFGGEL